MPTTSGTDPTVNAVRPAAQVRGLGAAIVAWGTADGASSRRPGLPWRVTRDPWAVLVAEVMLQQTQVSRAVPAYHRFLDRFPTPAACADAPLGDVLRAWEGLGYNRRARGLHGAAAAVVERHGGEVPAGLEDLLALPGVGPYTARAVLAFAFEADVGVVDTNAGRVLSRAVAGRPLKAAEAQCLVDDMVPPRSGWAFNQALLDLGATICVSGVPRCGTCPVRRRCRWAVAGRPSPDPAHTSAGVSAPQPAFEGSDRQGRGRLIDALRRGRLGPGEVAIAMGWADQPERVARVAEGLVAEGLVVRDRSGVLALP